MIFYSTFKRHCIQFYFIFKIFFGNLQKEDDKLKAVMRRESKQRRIKEKAYKRGITTQFMESGYDEDDDENATSTNATKRKYKSGKRKHSQI